MTRSRPPSPSFQTWILSSIVAAAVLASSGGVIQAQSGPGTYWLQSQGLQPWEWFIDHDGDSFNASQEYAAGTDPFDDSSFLSLDITNVPPDVLLDWDSVLGALYQLLGSPDMTSFSPLLDPIPGDGFNIEVLLTPAEQANFYCLQALAPIDADNDGLSAIEEAMIGTDPLVSDTDRDSILDGAEVLIYQTNPLAARIMGGTIRGTILSDPNGDGDLSDGTPVEGAKVFLDSNFNGAHDDGEQFRITPAGGSYRFILLPPGLYHVRQELPAATVQTLPAAASNANLDTWPDTLIDYTHVAPGVAPFDSPYGFKADDPWPGQQFVINPPVIEEVDPALVLKPIGVRDQVPPIGIWDTTEILSIPEDGSVTVGFDEVIVDLPGPDLNVIRTVQGGTTELTDIFVGPDEFNLTFLTTMNQGDGTGNVFPIDLSAFSVAPPIQVVKLVSKVPPNPAPGPAGGGSDQGAAIVGFQALNFVGPDTDARVVTIVGNETVQPVDFGRFFDDRQPTLSLGTDTALLQVSMATNLTFFAADDIGVVSRSLTANGTPVALNADGEGAYTPPYPGTVLFKGTATDTGGQVTTREWLYYVLDAGGSLPFDPNLLGSASGDSTTQIQVFSPGAGSVPTADVEVIATIASTSTPIWSVEYAPIADIDPNNLSLPDPDYISLGSGTSFVNSSPVGVFPASSLATGIYFIRISATPSGGGAAKYYGHVLGVGVNEADLRPEITITAPASGTNANLVQDIVGSISSTHPLTEWYVDYALRSEVDPANIGSDEPNWTRIADGVAIVNPAATLANFDTTVVPNDAYILRVVAWNDLRLGRVEAVELEVTHQAKLGRHHRVFSDLEIDLAGFPLAISRVYDSYEADNVGDFGHGWSLALSNPNIRETVPQTGVGIFGATPFRDGTRIYLNSPEDPKRRIGFTFRPVFASGSAFGSIYKATFEPDPGVYETLEIPEGDLGFLQIDGEGNVILVFIALPFNPDRYILTTKNGNRYTLEQGRGFVEAEDPNGNRLSYSPEDGFAHSAGQTLKFTRDGLGRITQITDPAGGNWTFAYDANGDLESVTNPDAEVTTYGYFALPAHFLEDITDPYGRVGTRFEYAADGRLHAVISENGERVLVTWDPGSFGGSIVDGRGNTTQLIYDDRGNVLSLTDPNTATTTFTYDDPLNPDLATTRTDPLGQVTTYEYDGLGNQTKVFVDGSFFSNWTITYNEFSQVTAVDLPGFHDPVYEYDAAGNLTRSVNRLGKITDYTHSPEGRLASRTVEGSTEYFTYDPITGDLASRTSLLGPSAEYHYDARGNLEEVEDAFGNSFHTETDASGTPVSTTAQDGNTAPVIKNPDGTWEYTDHNGMTTTLRIAANGTVRSSQSPDGFTLAPVFDENENVVALTDPNGNTPSWTYDLLDRMESHTDGAGETAFYDHDPIGRVIEIVDRNGKKRTFTYNEFNLITSECWHRPDDTILRKFTYTYSTSPLNLGVLEAVTDGSSTWTFAGGFLLPSKVTYAFDGQSPFEVAYTWSTAENFVPREVKLFDQADVFQDGEIETTYAGDRPYEYQWTTPDDDGRHIRLFYDAMGRRERLERYDVAFTASLATNPFARTRFTYNANNHLESISHEDAAGALLFPQSSLLYGRASGGMIQSVTQPTNTATFTYDSLGQVTDIDHTAYSTEFYTYDPAGNRLTSHRFAGTAVIGDANRPSAEGDLSFEWDAAGNLDREINTVSGEIREFHYDHRSQLIRIDHRPSAMDPPTTVAEFEYDFMGRLMNRTVAGQKTWIVHDRNMPAGEFLDGESEFSAMFFYAPEDTDQFFGVWRRGVGERWFLHDTIGSVRGVIDETAAPLAWVDYDGFGNPLGSDAGMDTIRFGGRFWNEAAKLYENRLRSYSPSLGRFIQEDPQGFAAGDLNVYRYVGNNPTVATDPFGTNALITYGQKLRKEIKKAKKYKEIAKCIAMILETVAAAIETQGGSGGDGGTGLGCIGAKLPPIVPLGPLTGPLLKPFFPPYHPNEPPTVPLLSL